MGRTALMKYMYLLQAVRNVPLDYHFTLYSYGPFDSDVLADLSIAESLEAVESELVLYSGGYGYKIRPNRDRQWLQKRAGKFINRYEEDVTWVITHFGYLTSAELELVGTIVYVDQECSVGKHEGLQRVAELVHEIKPHFSMRKILEYAQNLADEDVLQAAA
ncbi:MAG TPA: hypothetical protein VLV49_02270 [Terriglobales bacterium]|nr:hypothetical protein [Terriglobales bacterium]